MIQKRIKEAQKNSNIFQSPDDEEDPEVIVDKFDDVELEDEHVEGLEEEDEIEPSARIVHHNVDGHLEFNLNTE